MSKVAEIATYIRDGEEGWRCDSVAPEMSREQYVAGYIAWKLGLLDQLEPDPEHRAWHEAKPGESWLLTVQVEGEEPREVLAVKDWEGLWVTDEVAVVMEPFIVKARQVDGF